MKSKMKYFLARPDKEYFNILISIRERIPEIKIKEEFVMRINNNIMAMNAQRQLTINANAQGKSLE
ncbi:MAG: hypothetical protein N3B21_13700, partial [Clostridia bacterium]|nr:hypothetical protein [Clostridia bacterium]